MPGDVLVAGELTDLELRQAVLGGDVPARAETLPDHVVIPVEGGALIAARAGGAALVLRLQDMSDAAHARLEYYLTAMGARELSGGVWGGEDTGAKPWNAADWTSTDWQIARAAAREIMSLRGYVQPQDITRRLEPLRARVWSHITATCAPIVADRDLPDPKQLRVHSHRPVHHGFFRYDQVEMQVPMFDGTLSPVAERELYVSADAALVLPYDPRRDRVLMLEQFRFGMWRRGDPQPWSIEPVAGMIDPGETPETCARREAVEEAGITLTSLERIASGYASPGYSTAMFHMFVALCDIPDMGGRIGGVVEESEDIRSLVLPFERALAMAEEGAINIAPVQLMLFWLDRHRARLRASVS